MDTYPHHINRLYDEALDLHGKITRLTAFLSTGLLQEEKASERALLVRQLQYMTGYFNVLEERMPVELRKRFRDYVLAAA